MTPNKIMIQELLKEIGPDEKYVGVKVVGLNVWLWFHRYDCTATADEFTGKKGWGQEGERTNLRIAVDQIEGVITSEHMQGQS